MESISKKIKNKLNSLIEEISKLRYKFTKNRDKDFSRKRKLNFSTTLKLILSMGGKSLGMEMLDFFKFNEKTATSSAFIQARHKIKIDAFKAIFEKFKLPIKKIKTFLGYRILAHDGSDVNLPKNIEDLETHQGNGVNLLHLNAFYDVLNKVYLDADLQGKCKTDERESLNEMIDNSNFTHKTIVLGDRGYESFNIFAHIENKGYKYLIRAKDVQSNGIIAHLPLPKTNTFDVDIKIYLTRRQTNEIKSNPNFKFLSSNSKFDYLTPKSNSFYEINFRVVRLELSQNSYETLVTNLSPDEFTSPDLKKLYHMRWGIETSFRELKYALGLCRFHAKTKAFIVQEIYARLIMYNFCMMIICQIVVQKTCTKCHYQVNFTVAIHICRNFFKYSGTSPPKVEALIQKYILPIRKNRTHNRVLRPKSFITFLYRIA